MIEIAALMCLIYAVCRGLEDEYSSIVSDVVAEAILGFNFAVLGAVLLVLLGFVPPSALSFFFFTFVVAV